jgi:invasion protein IalB
MRCLPLIVLAGSVLAAFAAVAQERPRPAHPNAPPAGSWAKLCETPTTRSMDPLGKPRTVGVKTCLVFHEQIDATSGALRVAAGVEQTEGRQTLTIKVMPDVSREPGLHLAIMPRDVWQIVQRNQAPLTESQLSKARRLNLTYSLCAADGCIAETEATPKLVADLKSGGGLMILTLKGKHAFAYMVSLGGFREAYDGPPMDSAKFNAARAELLRELRKRQDQRPQPRPQRRPGDREI